ncbi:chaperone SurA [Amylibacter ulvae]|uniref:Parvulin-like PPIase n=1 Tax=Paramylibacter ulvae TaxID=1651968 RepID=A0ABQ3CR84_9RHOB|nr:peptidylprolyl isomerase [Amylibacter ulvae]GHA40388.1 chaperone SurA [Amylibacter ulvae]
MNKLMSLVLGCFMVCAQIAYAQAPFNTAIAVNDGIITNYEISQRTAMITAFGGGGDTRDTAVNQLIDERLYQHAANLINVTVGEDEIAEGMEEFANRGNLSTEQIIQYLAARGIEEQSFRDFVTNGLLWRQVVRARFSRQATVTDNEIDNALGGANQGALSLLISEIVIPHIERGPDGAKQLAQQLSDSIKSQGAFSSAARRYSRSPSARNGGRLDWVPAANLPTSIITQLLALENNEVTGPLELNNATAIFQLRGTRRDATAAKETTVSYAQVPLPTGVELKKQIAAARVLINKSDRCLDLRANAEKYGANAYQESAALQSELPQTIAMELAKLDRNEAGYYANSAGGMSVIMLCSRTTELQEGEREALRGNIFNRKIAGLGNGYLQELKGSAYIEYK